MPDVVIIGGGFAGINVVKGLKEAPVRIALVDRLNYHLFQPLLYQVATATLSEDDIATPIRTVLRDQTNVTVALAELTGIDLDRQVVYGSRGEKHYDYLVIATGVTQSYFGYDEFKPFAPGLKTLDDALEIRRRVLMAFEEAEHEADDESRQGKLTFVVVGGGPTGVELAGALKETATYTLPSEFRNIDTKTARVILVQSGATLLKGMPEAMGARAHRDLEEMGVEVRLNSHVTSVDALGVTIGEERVPAENVLWAAGVHGAEIAGTLGVELDRAGRVVVESDLSIPGHPNAFVIGDAAHAIDTKTDQIVPGVAQGAIQMGRFVANIIRHEVAENSKVDRPAFHYTDKGSMATIGRAKAVTSVGDRTFGGFMGWMAWGLIHIYYLIGFRTKVVVLLEWFWSFFFQTRGSRLITGDSRTNIKEVRGVDMFDIDKHKH